MAQRIKNFITNEDGTLADILKKANGLKNLNERINQHLRPELVGHCAVASLEQGLLRIAVDSAAFAIQLRYDAPQLLEQFCFDETLPKIKAIDCYVDVEWNSNYRY